MSNVELAYLCLVIVAFGALMAAIFWASWVAGARH